MFTLVEHGHKGRTEEHGAKQNATGVERDGEAAATVRDIARYGAAESRRRFLEQWQAVAVDQVETGVGGAVISAEFRGAIARQGG